MERGDWEQPIALAEEQPSLPTIKNTQLPTLNYQHSNACGRNRYGQKTAELEIVECWELSVGSWVFSPCSATSHTT